MPISAPHSASVPAPTLPRLGSPMGAPASQAPNYDEQIGLTFTEGSSSLGYNVTAVAQSDSDGFGPAYLLNGLTDKGYWYQVGLSWNWDPGSSPGTGFAMNYEAFDNNGYSVYPTNGEGGLLALSGPVNPGDPVALSLGFSGGEVTMVVLDENTGATASTSYNGEGASQFIGLLSPSNSNGFFTGLMTEQYHDSAYYGGTGQVTYSTHHALSGGFLWADEFAVTPRSAVFFGSKFVNFQNPNQIQSFEVNGTTAYADAYSFITGALGKALLTLSYAVVGGGTAYSPPELRYTLDGSVQTATLTGTPTTFFVDAGSGWEATNALQGGTATERWETNQQTSGNLSAALEVDLLYFHQFLYAFGFTVTGGGTGYSPPTILSSQFGSPAELEGGAPAWVDAGSDYSYPQTLSGSTSAERWVSFNATGLVDQSGTVSVPYYHQFGLTLSYSYTGGGARIAPVLSGTQFSKPFSKSISNSTVYFLDPGTAWSVEALLPGGISSERWVALTGTNGSVSGPESALVIYRHQFFFTVVLNPLQGGTTPLADGWMDAGSTLQLTQTASPGWKFEAWSGSGNGSFTGSSNSSSVELDSPIQENATFYPGLQISAGENGEVTYTLGSQTGIVRAGSTSTLYAPQGTGFTLSAAPSSFLYSFSGWSQGATGTNRTTKSTLTSPSAITASFSLNIPILAGVALGIALVVAAATSVLRHRGRPDG